MEGQRGPNPGHEKCPLKWIFRQPNGSQLEYLKYSNYFDFYPYTLSKDEQWFIMHTASQVGLDDAVERFHGQTSPELATAELLEEFYDKRLLSSLLDKWVDRYVRRKKRDRNTAALFRSLDMAYRASVIPQLNLHDFGTNIALWVSALEILVHPKNGKVNRNLVLAFLDKTKFLSRGVSRRLHTIKTGNTKARVSLVVKTCYEMYSARNDFLHGNAVASSKLFPAKNRQCLHLTICALLVYKCALMSSLNMFKDIDIDISGDLSSSDKELLNNLFKIKKFEQTLMKMREPKE